MSKELDPRAVEQHHDLLQALFYHMAKPGSRFSSMSTRQLQGLVAIIWTPDFVTHLIQQRPEYHNEFNQAVASWKRETNLDGTIHLVETLRENNVIPLKSPEQTNHEAAPP